MTLMPAKKKSRTGSQSVSSVSCMMVLEPRIMYDGAGVISMVDAADEATIAADSHDAAHTEPEAQANDSEDLFRDYVPPADNQPTELIFIDPGVEDGQQLASSIQADNQMVIILNPAQGGLSQITSYLGGLQNVEAIHIVSHGGPASLEFSSGAIGLAELESNAEILSSWSSSLSQDADILIYGCQVAAGEDGQQFIDLFSQLTQADVGASIDLTGAASQGGDWDLEAASGQIEALTPAAITGYQGVLAETEYVDTGQNIANLAANDVALGDLNGDGTLDAVVATTNNVQIYNNDGTGIFTYTQSLSSSTTQQVALTDINGDGYLDAVLATEGATDDEIWINNGSGSFTLFDSLTNTDSVGVVAADLDNDGDQDVIFISGSANDTVYRNDGTGSLTAFTTINTTTSSDIALADLNNDGAMDVVVTTSSSATGNTVWLNNGAASFTGATLASFNSATGVSLGDVDGDGDADAVFSYSDSANELWINSGTGSFTNSGQSLQSTTSDSQDIVLTDTDLDGDLDVIVANDDVSSEILLNNGSGTFSVGDAIAYSGNASGLTVGDLDGDTDHDLLIQDSSIATSIFVKDVQPTVDLAASMDYTENYPYTQLDGSLLISDTDSPELTGVTIVISSGYVNGEDLLSFNDTGTITGSWNASIGTLTLSGTDTLANYQAALQSITYYNTSDDPSTAIRTVTFTLNDGITEGPASSMSVTVTAVNDEPEVVAGSTLAFTENMSVQVIDATITVSDADHANLQGATIVLSSGYSEGDDVLAFTDTGTITGSWNATTGTLTLSGTDTVANYEAALQSITYTNQSDSHSETDITNKTITWTVTDGTYSSTPVTSAITVTGLNDAPELDTLAESNLSSIDEDETDSSGDTVGTITFGVISDADNGASTGIAVVLLDTANGAWQYSDDQGTTWSDFGTVSDTSATLLAYGTLIRFVPEADFNGTATLGYRGWDMTTGTAGGSVDATINGGTTSISADYSIATLTVNAVNDPPELDGATTVEYEENEAAISAMPYMMITDVDSPNLESATVVFGNGYLMNQDMLSFTDTGAITATWNPSLGTLTLSGTDTVANYQEALRAITYEYQGEYFESSSISLTISVNDGESDSAQATVTINRTDLNDAPVLDNSQEYQLTAIDEDPSSNSGDLVSNIINGLITDADQNALQGIAVVMADSSNGDWQYSVDSGTTWIDFGDLSNTSATLLASDSLIRFVPDADYNGSATINYRAWDQSSGTSGDTMVDVTVTGGTSAFSTAYGVASVDVDQVNDAPVVTSTYTLEYTENDAAALLAPYLELSDVDSTTLTTATISMGSGYVAGEDLLSFTNTGSISASWNQTLGILTLTGTDTVANYQAALRSITYESLGESFATETVTVSITVSDGEAYATQATTTINRTNVNDAPVLDTTTPYTPSSIDEDAESISGFLVSDILSEVVTDPDTDPLEGIAVIDADMENGDWQYSLDNGTTWIDLGSLSESSATLLGSDALLRFEPTANYNGSATLTYLAWDQTESSSGTAMVDVSESGGTTAYGDQQAVLTLTVAAVDDLPVLSSPEAVNHYENDTTTAIAPQITITEVDNEQLTSATITISTGYDSEEDSLLFTDTETIIGSWDSETGILTLSGSDTAANYEAALQSILYQNSSDNPSTEARVVTITISDAVATTEAVTVSLTVVSENDQPVLDTTEEFVLTGISEEEFDSSGDTISDILGSTVSDADDEALSGIAVSAADTDNGSWQYSMDAGETWIDFDDDLSETSATLLDLESLIRFVPETDFAGTATITFHAWDQTEGSAGDTEVDLGEIGDDSPYSSETASASIEVSNINDAPVMSNATGITYNENDDPTPIEAELILTDVDPEATMDYAVIAFESGYVSGEDLLAFTDTETITGEWDEESGTLTLSGTDTAENYEAALQSVTYENLSDNPDTEDRQIAFSVFDGELASETLSTTIEVVSVNDSPIIDTSEIPSFTSMAEEESDNGGESIADIIGDTITDADEDAMQGIAVIYTDETNGSWQYSMDNGETWLDFGDLSNYEATLLDADHLIRFVPDADFTGYAYIYYKGWDQTSGSDGDTEVDTTGGETGSSFSAESGYGWIYVENINDQPILTGSGATIAYTENDLATVIDSSITIEDIDNDTLQYAMITVSSGYVAGEDMLAYSGSDTITASWDDETGTLTLSGSDTLENYEAALQAVTYENMSNAPSETDKVISFTVFDGEDSSEAISNGVTVTVVNDAPLIQQSPLEFTPTSEDIFEPAGQSVSSLTDSMIMDYENPDMVGIAVIDVASDNGLWQYSLDSGQTWMEFGELSTSSATLLGPESLIRFIPEADFYGSVSISLYGWDQTSGQVGDTGVELSSMGGESAYSASAATATLMVENVNDPSEISGGSSHTVSEDDGAMVLDGTVSLSDIDNDTLQSATITMSSGYMTGHDLLTFSDTATITSSWDAAAGILTLSGEDSLENYQAALQSVTYQNLADNPTTGKVISFSVFDGTDQSAAITTSVTITHVNDAPVLDVSDPILFSDVESDDIENSGDRVADFLMNDNFEPDESGLHGMAVISVDNSHGLWQYSLDSGQTWQEFGDLSEEAATLLDGDSLVRFVPDDSYAGHATILFRSWDQTSGASGQTGVDVTMNGATTSLSSEIGTGQVYVKIKPAPQFTPTESTYQGQVEPPISESQPIVPAHEVQATPLTFHAIQPGEPYFQQAGQLPDVGLAEHLDQVFYSEPIRAEHLSPAEEELLLQATPEPPPPHEIIIEEVIEEVAPPEPEAPLEEPPEDQPLDEELVPEKEPGAAILPPPREPHPPETRPADKPGPKPAGLSAQLAAEAGKVEQERQQIINVFDQVFNLLQCD